MLNKCLLPVAGFGTRFLPATKTMPKEALPILNKPLVQYAVEEACAAGLTDVGLVTGRGKRAIEDHFDIHYELEDRIQGTGSEDALKDIRYLIDRCTFSYIRQRAMRGLGDAILTGEPLMGDAPFGVILADDLCLGEDLSVMGQMASVFAETGATIVAIQEVPAEHTSNYGIVAGREVGNGLLQVEDMVEKPEPGQAPSNLAIIGRYILTPDIFDILRNTAEGINGELQLTDALRTQAKGGQVLAYRFKGRRFDCGTIEGYVEATNYFYEAWRKAQEDSV